MVPSRTPIVEFDSSSGEWEEWNHFVSLTGKVVRKYIKSKNYFAYGLDLTKHKQPGFSFFKADTLDEAIRTLVPKKQHPYQIKFMGRDPLNKVFEFIRVYPDRPQGETIYLMSEAEEARLNIMAKYFPRAAF